MFVGGRLGMRADYSRYWGKAKPNKSQKAGYHLLAFHSLDVAAVGYHLLNPDQALGQSLARQLGLAPRLLQVVFSWCLALHDLGKFARAFQALAPNLSPELVDTQTRKHYSVRHDSLGYLVWQETTDKLLALGFAGMAAESRQLKAFFKTILPLMEAVTGHHGAPPLGTLDSCASFFEKSDLVAVLNFVQSVSELLLVLDISELAALTGREAKQRLRQASWQLAGVAVLADWLGSDQDQFTYQTTPGSLADYWQQRALRTAQQSVACYYQQQTNQPSEFISAQTLFPHIQQMTPLQAYASQVALPQRPQLFILEDVTGAGKTEAAMILAQRLMGQGLARGLYVALPTMATANAMYQRLSKAYRALFTQTSQPSLILAHGASRLSSDFRQSVGLTVQEPDLSYAQDHADLSASAFCNVWLADKRKAALLADVGVGTLDQALLSVLPVRHQSLRVLGLWEKLLLVDEVHAYDPYMNMLLQSLLHQHARTGGSVILLSATIPTQMRQQLTNAFYQGLDHGTSAAVALTHNDYPLVTHVAQEQLQETPLATRPSVSRRLTVQRLEDEAQVLALLQQTVEQGRCVCWVRNTVKAALQSYQQLLALGLSEQQCQLFHSRFAMQDRQTLETKVLGRFGEHSTASQRRGQVLIATQVVEQSLDLDFDVLVSDLAPMDLMLQRAGRLCRHRRDREGNPLTDGSDQRGEPRWYFLSPSPSPSPDAQWLRRLLPGTQSVYPHIGQLWLTAQRLQQTPCIEIPKDARALIEGVYAESAQSLIPEALQSDSLTALGEASCQRSYARAQALDFGQGYTWLSAGDKWSPEVEISTRIGNDSVTVALAKWVDGEPQPYAADAEHPWPQSQLSVPRSQWQQFVACFSPEQCALIQALKDQEHALRWVEVLPLWGALHDVYSPRTGLMIKEDV